MKKIIYLICSTLLLLPFGYVLFCKQYGSDFWQGMFSNMMATVLALIGGIPVALGIDNFSKKSEAKEKAAAERKKEKELLNLIKEELDFSHARLEERIANTTALPTQPLKADLWKAACDSGLISLINEPLLLNRISSAYSNLNIVRRIEEQCYKAIRGATVTFADGTTANQRLLADARNFDALLRSSIEEALRMIDQRINTF